MRREFFRVGVGWASGGADANARKVAERGLGALAKAGLAKVAGRGRIEHVRLTPAGDARARRLVGLPRLAEALEVAAELLALHRELGGVGEGGLDGDWIPETLLSGAEWGAVGFGHRAWVVEAFALPLLTAGMAESRATALGHILYKLTPAGEAQAAAVKRVTPWAWREVGGDERMEEYMEARARFQGAIETSRGDPQELGTCPLPVSGWPAEFLERYKAKMAAMGAAPADAIEGAGGGVALEGGG